MKTQKMSIFLVLERKQLLKQQNCYTTSNKQTNVNNSLKLLNKEYSLPTEQGMLDNRKFLQES